MSFRRSLIAMAITTSVVVAAGATTAGADLEANAAGERISGTDRYATSAQVADQICADGQPINFIVASGARFPDALAASALAGQLGNSAILLTDPTTLRPSTQAELRHARSFCTIASITIVGGTAAVSAGVQASLAAFGPVTRIAGANRYETAVAVSEQVASAGNTVLLATGTNFPDALSGGVLAYVGPHALLLNNGTSLLPIVRDYIVANGVTNVIVLGGTQAVPASVVNQINALAGVQAERLAGADRYDTAARIATFLENSGAIAGANVLLANGVEFPDALSAAPYGGLTGAPILLTAATSLSVPTRNFLQARSGSVVTITAIGGTAAVSNATLAAAITAAGGTAPPTPPPSPIFTLRSGTFASGPVSGGDIRVSVVLDFNRRVAQPATANLGGITLIGGEGGLAVSLTAASAEVTVTPDGFGLALSWINPEDVEILAENPRIQVAANTIFDTDNDPLAPTTKALKPGPPL